MKWVAGFFVSIGMAISSIFGGHSQLVVNPVANPVPPQNSTSTSTSGTTSAAQTSTATNWITGDSMDYPSDVTMTPHDVGSETGPDFIFPASYFSGSSISSAEIKSSSSCGSDVPSTNSTINGLNFYQSPDGLTYDFPGACNESIQLVVVTGSPDDVNSAAYQNLKSIFGQMIESLAKKFSPANVSAPNTINIAGMQQYTDPSFGFSFWYPNAWQVSTLNSNNAAIFSGGQIVKTYSVGSNPDNMIDIYEVYAPNSITIPNNIDYPTYYFDAGTHTWMTYTSDVPNPEPATVSNNTMGGLHMLSGVPFYPTAIPLSAHNFLVIGDPQAGIGRTDPLAKTILATNPAVATPVSQAQQTATIQAEANEYEAVTTSSMSGTNSQAPLQTYTNSQYGFSLQYPGGIQIDTAAASEQSFVANIYAGTHVAVIVPIGKSFSVTESDLGTNGVVTIDGNAIVSVSTNSTDMANCMTAPAGAEISVANVTDKNINNVDFLSYDIDQPAAGLLELDHTYTVLHDGVCYSIDSQIDGAESSHMSASDGATNDAVTAELAAELDSIAQSFRFTR